MTLNQTITRIRTLALNHNRVSEFYFGSVSDFLDLDKQRVYPICVLDYSPSAIAGNVLSFSFIMYVLDLVNISEGARANEQDVLSDSAETVSDLYASFNAGNYTDWRVSTTNQIELLREEQPEYIAGAAISFTIDTLRIQDACVKPVGVNLQWGYFDEDPYSYIDIAEFQYNEYIVDQIQSYKLDFKVSEKYLVVKEHFDQPEKTRWFNTSFNYGVIPDQVFRSPVIIGGVRYYVSRKPVVLQNENKTIDFYV